MRNIIIYFLSTVVASGVPFFITIILARFLPVEDTGLIALYNTQVSIGVLVVGLGAYASVQARYFLDPNKFASYLSSSVVFHTFCFLLALIILSLFGESIESWSGMPLWAICAAVFVAFSQCILNMHLLLSQARGLVERFLFIQLSQTIPLAVFAPLISIYMGLGWKGFVVAQLIQFLLISIWNISALVRLFGLGLNFNFKDFAANWRFGLSLLPHSLACFVVIGYDRIYVYNNAGPIATGIYSIILQIGMLVSMIVVVFNKVYTPWLYSRLREEKQWNLIANTTWKGILVVIILCSIFYPIALFGIEPLLGENFLPGRDLIGWMILAGMVNGIYLLMTNMIFFSERMYYLSIASVFGALVKWFLMPWLYGLYGLKGVAASNVVALMVITLMVMVFIVYIYDRRVLFGNLFGSEDKVKNA